MKIRNLHRAFILLLGTLALSAPTSHAADKFEVIIPSPADLKWSDTGPQFPNTKVVILHGDPGKAGDPVTLRWHCPANYKFMPHTHPGVENITVLTGTFMIGVGPKYETAELKEVRAGGYFVLAAEQPHFGKCKGDTIIEVHTTGPLGTTYVDSADDPSKKH